MVKIKASKRVKKRYLLVQGKNQTLENLVKKDKMFWFLKDRTRNLKTKNTILVINRKDLERAIQVVKETNGATLLKVSGTLKGIGAR